MTVLSVCKNKQTYCLGQKIRVMDKNENFYPVHIVNIEYKPDKTTGKEKYLVKWSNNDETWVIDPEVVQWSNE